MYILMSIFGLGLIASVVSIIKVQIRLDDLSIKIKTLETDINTLFEDEDLEDEYYDLDSED